MNRSQIIAISGLLMLMAGAVSKPGFGPARALAPMLSGHRPHLSTNDPAPQGISAQDWSSIRQQHERRRHAAFSEDGGHQARNPGQQWRTRFDGRGFITRPEIGDWQWGLELRNYGFPGHEQDVAGPPRVSAEGQRVAYDWNAGLEEWFVNDERGLEHGFTLRERPAGAGDRLLLNLAIRGGLRPEVLADGRGVRFLDTQGAVAITYAGLTAFDADGRTRPARFEPAPDGVRMVVEERGARYPLTIDPVAQQAYLKSSNTAADDNFGWSVSVSGDTVVIGADWEDSNATTINGNQSNNSASSAGAAYVFVRNGTNWTQQAYLKASNAGIGDNFGHAVAISGDTIVVGAFWESSSATGVNGNQSNNSAPKSGAAYVFVRNGTNWTQQAYLKASNTQENNNFGQSVAIWGDTVVVGAYQESSNATGVNGNGNDDSAPQSGAAYVFVRNGTNWTQQAYLKASNTGPYDNFGWSVAGWSDTIVVGAHQEASNASGVNGNQSDNSAFSAGAAYVFSRSGTNWTQQAYLKASNAQGNDFFGYSVAASSNTIMVGAWGESSNATGVNGNQSNNSASFSGAAYVFVRPGTNWTQQAYLKASNTDASDRFGWSVALSGDTAVVGAIWEASNATGVNGNQSANNAFQAGAAYVFVRNGFTWSQKDYLKASNTDPSDSFGWSVAVSGDTVMIGAYIEASKTTGVNGNQSDNSLSCAGAVYAFADFVPPLLLSTQRAASNLRVFWPLPAHGFVLDEVNLFGASTNWSQVPFPYQTNTTQISVTLPMPGTNQFFRLRKP